MTIPANDAFTLGLTHNPNRLALHSSTSKLSFVAGAKTPHSVPLERRLMSAKPRIGSDSGHHTQREVDTQSSTTIRSPSTNRNGRETKSDARNDTVDWEIPRKILHSSIGFFTLYLYASHGSPRAVVAVLSAGLAILIPCDILRLRSRRFERIFERCVGFLMRESEKKSTNGVIWYIIGVIFVLSVYPLDIAVVSILILSWADTAASTVGRFLGSRTPALPRHIPIFKIPLAPRKSVAGFVAASCTGACIAVGFWGWVMPLFSGQSSWRWITEAPMVVGVSSTYPWAIYGVLGLVSGLVSGVAEALDLGSLDDNLTLPIISGGCLWGFFKLTDTLVSWM
ncbi:uncharacterized protein FIBRA_00734 [Fibroporia radiculosa]|uniref:Phosphatidate cytidylyltransferase n=1 Tax=Fibroporia radiculosa TaxID=599839 RepID=J4H0K7_9APHY|nr:uncharacterized protein FIBRA_00734 [Fibroporia radiculosa]CCL98729.1 predicted protein [Fibroporia radiculosa]